MLAWSFSKNTSRALLKRNRNYMGAWQELRFCSASVDLEKCWKCGTPHARGSCCVLFCSDPSCKAIQNLNMNKCNYYDLFSIPNKQTTTIDLGKLEQSFKSLQRLLHPDKFVNASLEEKNISASNSSEVNQGYQIMKSKIDRINYLLTTFYGVDVLGGAAGSYSDKELMAEIFELRERIDDETSQIKDGKRNASILLQDIDSTLETISAQLDDVLKDRYDSDTATRLAVRLKYFSKIKEELIEKVAC